MVYCWDMESEVSIPVGRSRVGGGEPVLVVLEAGPTHGGLGGALAIVEGAKVAGVQAVKFQLFDPDEVMADRDAKFSYEILLDEETGETELIEESLYQILLRRVLPDESWRLIAKRARELELDLFFTVAAERDIALACSLGAASLKIASGDLTYRQLIQAAAETRLPIQLDSGGGSQVEVSRALSWISEVPGASPAVIHHCPTGYPARFADIRLRAIHELKAMLGLPVAFSDHSPGWDMDVAAVALGADVIEKNVTHSRLTRDVEHLQAIGLHEVPHFVASIRSVESALQSGLSANSTASPLVRRGCYLLKDAEAGQPVSELAFKFQRPCLGIEPWQLAGHESSRLKRSMRSGEPLRMGDLDA